MANSAEEREPFLVNTKRLHSYAGIRLHDQKLEQDPDAVLSQALTDLRTASGLEIHATMNPNGVLLLGHPEEADFAARTAVTNDTMLPEDLVRAVKESHHIKRITLDHRPRPRTEARTEMEVIAIATLARRILETGKAVTINSPQSSFLDELAHYLCPNGVRQAGFQQQVDVPVLQGTLPGVAIRAMEKTRQNGGISEHASQIRIGDGFPVGKISIAEVTDFVATDGFRDGISRTLHATDFPTVGRDGEPFKIGEFVEGRQLKNIARVAKDTKGAISGVTRFARHEIA